MKPNLVLAVVHPARDGDKRLLLIDSACQRFERRTPKRI